jgi:hypothetical protein
MQIPDEAAGGVRFSIECRPRSIVDVSGPVTRFNI